MLRIDSRRIQKDRLDDHWDDQGAPETGSDAPTVAVPFEIDHFRFVGEVDPQTNQIIGTPRPMRRTYPLVGGVSLLV